MKLLITILSILTTLSAIGQSNEPKPGFVTEYFNDPSPENFEKILLYYDSINENYINVGHCWKYCLDINVDNNQVLLNGDSLKSIGNLPALLHEFLVNPKKFKFGLGENEDYGTKGRIEVHFNKNSVKQGEGVVRLTLKALRLYTQDLQEKGVMNLDSYDLDLYILNHMMVNNDWTPPKPPESKKNKN